MAPRGSYMRLIFVAMDIHKFGTAKSFRPMKLVKYLVRTGCEVQVVCAAPSAQDLEGELPDGAVYLTVPFRPPVDRTSVPKQALSRLFSWPEPQAWWVKPVIRELMPRLQAQRPDAVIVSSPPHSTQMIGVHLARRLKVPYFADFRDDWLTNNRLRFYTPIHQWLAQSMERQVIRHASAVLLNTEVVRSRFLSRYPQSTSRFYTLPNGYDDEDFSQSVLPMPGIPMNKKILLYAGDGYKGYIREKLSVLARQMKASGLDQSWHIVTAGTEGWLSPEFAGHWSHLGALPPSVFPGVLQQANLLLLPMPPGEESPSGTVPLKTYAYLRSGRAILYLGETGATTELLSRFEGTYCLDRTAWPGLAEWISRNAQSFSSPHSRRGLHEYSFAHLANRLLEIVRSQAGEHRTSCGKELG